MKVIVTNHAKDRFRQRFRLMFNRAVFEDGRDTFFISDLFSKSSQVDFSLKQKSGVYNALCADHGCRLDFFRYKDKIIFATTVMNNKRMILTCMTTEKSLRGHRFP